MESADKIFVHGLGAVSPAGWGMNFFRDALKKNEPLPTTDLLRPGWTKPLRVRSVPTPSPRPAFISHARLRRTSPIAQFATAAALEALGEDATKITTGNFRLGLVVAVLAGCVNYTRRFYDETLRDPASASPLVFPETVFNAPSSHIAALLGTTAINYTLVGDPGTFLQGVALAADWLLADKVDGCLVLGADEKDWLIADAFHLFQRNAIVSEGAGAIYFRREKKSEQAIKLGAVTDAHLFLQKQTRAAAAKKMREQFSDISENTLLCDGQQNLSALDAAEKKAWSDWRRARLSPKTIFGEGLVAGAAWQCLAAIDALQQGLFNAANVSVVGTNQQAIGAQFVRTNAKD